MACIARVLFFISGWENKKLKLRCLGTQDKDIHGMIMFTMRTNNIYNENLSWQYIATMEDFDKCPNFNQLAYRIADDF